MSDATLRGVLPMLVTPYDADGAVAIAELEAIAEAALADGAHGLAVNGLGGEVQALSASERDATAAAAIRVADGLPVVVGASAPDTELAVRIADQAAEAGAAALMVAPPPEPDWPRERLVAHYAAVATTVAPVPVMVQDAPAFVGVTLDDDFVAELRAEHANVRYAKPESVPAADAVARLASIDGLGVFGGHGGLYLLDVLAAGGDGVIPGPDQTAAFVRVVEAWWDGEAAAARGAFTALLPVLVAQFQSLPIFIASVKRVLHARGLVSTLSLRGTPWPLGSTSESLLLAAASQLR